MYSRRQCPFSLRRSATAPMPPFRTGDARPGAATGGVASLGVDGSPRTIGGATRGAHRATRRAQGSRRVPLLNFSPGAAAIAPRSLCRRPAPEGRSRRPRRWPGHTSVLARPRSCPPRPPRLGPHLVSWLLNFLVTTLPSSRPRRSATRWDRSWCELPLKSTMLGMVALGFQAVRCEGEGNSDNTATQTATAVGAGKRAGGTQGRGGARGRSWGGARGAGERRGRSGGEAGGCWEANCPHTHGCRLGRSRESLLRGRPQGCTLGFSHLPEQGDQGTRLLGHTESMCEGTKEVGAPRARAIL